MSNNFLRVRYSENLAVLFLFLPFIMAEFPEVYRFLVPYVHTSPHRRGRIRPVRPSLVQNDNKSLTSIKVNCVYVFIAVLSEIGRF